MWGVHLQNFTGIPEDCGGYRTIIINWRPVRTTWGLRKYVLLRNILTSVYIPLCIVERLFCGMLWSGCNDYEGVLSSRTRCNLEWAEQYCFLPKQAAGHWGTSEIYLGLSLRFVKNVVAPRQLSHMRHIHTCVTDHNPLTWTKNHCFEDPCRVMCVVQVVESGKNAYY